MKAREREAGDGEEKQTEKTVTTVNTLQPLYSVTTGHSAGIQKKKKITKKQKKPKTTC